MRKLVPAIVGALLVVGCGQPPRSGAVSPTATENAPTASPSVTPAIAVSVAASQYGKVQLLTNAGAACTLAIKIDPGQFGDGPPTALSAVATMDGTVAFAYPAPFIPAGHGRHHVACTDPKGSVETEVGFDVGTRVIDPRAFRVRTQAVDPIAGLSGIGRLDPSLVARRDANLARLNATLPDEWKLATRGLGSLSLVSASSDITIYVLPGKGVSVHELAPDGSQRVLLYVVDDLGPVTAENGVATALHELGHIWCCFGAGAGPDGHWLEKIADPLLQGVDRYGLMTHPVTCLVGRGFESCPNRFSERELRTMGFSDIPAPPPDPCVSQAAAMDAQLASQRATIDAERAQLASVQARVSAIEAQYPSHVLPPDVYLTYQSLVDQYNAMARDADAKVTAYNALVSQRNALPC